MKSFLLQRKRRQLFQTQQNGHQSQTTPFNGNTNALPVQVRPQTSRQNVHVRIPGAHFESNASQLPSSNPKPSLQLSGTKIQIPSQVIKQSALTSKSNVRQIIIKELDTRHDYSPSKTIKLPGHLTRSFALRNSMSSGRSASPSELLLQHQGFCDDDFDKLNSSQGCTELKPRSVGNSKNGSFRKICNLIQPSSNTLRGNSNLSSKERPANSKQMIKQTQFMNVDLPQIPESLKMPIVKMDVSASYELHKEEKIDLVQKDEQLFVQQNNSNHQSKQSKKINIFYTGPETGQPTSIYQSNSPSDTRLSNHRIVGGGVMVASPGAGSEYRTVTVGLASSQDETELPIDRLGSDALNSDLNSARGEIHEKIGDQIALQHIQQSDDFNNRPKEEIEQLIMQKAAFYQTSQQRSYRKQKINKIIISGELNSEDMQPSELKHHNREREVTQSTPTPVIFEQGRHTQQSHHADNTIEMIAPILAEDYQDDESSLQRIENQVRSDSQNQNENNTQDGIQAPHCFWQYSKEDQEKYMNYLSSDTQNSYYDPMFFSRLQATLQGQLNRKKQDNYRNPLSNVISFEDKRKESGALLTKYLANSKVICNKRNSSVMKTQPIPFMVDINATPLGQESVSTVPDNFCTKKVLTLASAVNSPRDSQILGGAYPDLTSTKYSQEPESPFMKTYRPTEQSHFRDRARIKYRQQRQKGQMDARRAKHETELRNKRLQRAQPTGQLFAPVQAKVYRFESRKGKTTRPLMKELYPEDGNIEFNIHLDSSVSRSPSKEDSIDPINLTAHLKIEESDKSPGVQTAVLSSVTLFRKGSMTDGSPAPNFANTSLTKDQLQNHLQTKNNHAIVVVQNEDGSSFEVDGSSHTSHVRPHTTQNTLDIQLKHKYVNGQRADLISKSRQQVRTKGKIDGSNLELVKIQSQVIEMSASKTKQSQHSIPTEMLTGQSNNGAAEQQYLTGKDTPKTLYSQSFNKKQVKFTLSNQQEENQNFTTAYLNRNSYEQNANLVTETEKDEANKAEASFGVKLRTKETDKQSAIDNMRLKYRSNFLAEYVQTVKIPSYSQNLIDKSLRKRADINLHKLEQVDSEPVSRVRVPKFKGKLISLR